ncbi:MAG: hypothetical protein MJ211_12010 [Bacteroidales bacterium]|nr:hypothetical protein [Bacteroidales bacterium]
MISVFGFLLLGCQSKIVKLSDELNLSKEKDSINISCIDSIKINDSRSIIYMLDASCSACIQNYINFVQDFNINKPNCDSVYTICYGSKDFLLVEYYMKQCKVTSLTNEKIIFDKNGLVNQLQTITNNRNIILLINKKISFITDDFYYKFNSEYGYYKEI